MAAGENLVKSFHADGAPNGRVSQNPSIQTDESAAHYVPEVVLCHHGCGFVAFFSAYVLKMVKFESVTYIYGFLEGKSLLRRENEFCVLSWCRCVVSNGGWSAAQVGVGAARICDRLLFHCLLGPGRSLDLILRFLLSVQSPLLLCPLLLIGLLASLIDGAVSSSLLRAEVVDREDFVKQRFVLTVAFGPVFRVPDNLAKGIFVL